MNLVIPFVHDIKFDTTISEILSVSLEHDYTLNTNEVLGNFTVCGEYKPHELSVNKKSFKYVVPFSVQITEDINPSTLDFEVQNFTYDVVDKEILRVNIEYSINASLKEIQDNEEPDERQLLTEEEDVEEHQEEQPVTEEQTENEKEQETQEQETLIESINTEEDTYITYHIHIMSDTDTIDTVCTKYNTTKESLEQYNDISTLVTKDKLIIPDENE